MVGDGSPPDGPAVRLAAEIRRNGPVPFERFAEVALYGPGGFFARGRGAGRAGRDFVTAPETGSLFGALVAAAIDRMWDDLGRPDPLVVVEAGAGNGRLARDVLRAEPTCAPALRYVLVERSAVLRAEQREGLAVEPAADVLGRFVRTADDEAAPAPGQGPLVTSLDSLPALAVEGVVLANELLDDLPFGVARWDGSGWEELRVGTADGRFVEVLVPASESVAAALDAVTEGLAVPVGARLPVPIGVEAWLRDCAATLTRGCCVLVDYVDGVGSMLARGWSGPSGWLRTYREHRRGGDPLADPGSWDITADVAREQLGRAARAAGFVVAEERSQAEWLTDLGLEARVEEGRAVWQARAHLGDLEAIAGRSRAAEAAALTDPAGLGAHRVVTLTRGVHLR